MITLNLISEELKKQIKFKHIFLLLKRIYYIFLVLIIVLSIMILSARIILQNRFNDVVEQTSLISRSDKSNGSKISEINSKLDTVAEIQDKFVYWSKLFSNIFNSISDDISLSYFSVNQLDKTIKFQGLAKTRESLLSLNNDLEKSNLFTDINFPMSNILEEKNINFEINAKINLSQLK